MLANDFYLLLGYSFVLFLFIWGSQKLISKHYLQRFAYRHHKKSRAKSKTHHLLKEKKGELINKKETPKEEIQIENKNKSKENEKEKSSPKQKPIPKVVIPHQAKSKSSSRPRPRRPVSSRNSNPLVSELERINQELAKLR